MTSNTNNNDAFEALFTTTAQTSFNMTPHNWQRRLGGRILRDKSVRGGFRQLCIQPTGGGKTLLFHTIACYLKGVSICIVPLLSLGADQVNKTMLRTANDPSTWAVHLDDLLDADVGELLLLIKEMDDKTTVMLYSSPQFLTERFPSFIKLLSKSSRIRMIVVDEIHLFAQFGRSFRSEFNDLKTKLFLKVPKKTIMLFLTATCTKRIKSSFEKCIGVNITHTHWPSATQMIDRKVSLFVTYSSRPFSNMSKSIALMLKDNTEFENSKFIVYSNVRSRIKDVKEGLSRFFDKDDQLFETDVMCIHGQLSKEEKSRYTQIFLDPEVEHDKAIRVLCATSGVGNVGIDSSDIRSVYRLEFPPSIMDFVQEKGRAGRIAVPDPSSYAYHLYYSLESYVYIFERTMNPDANYIDESYRNEILDDALEVAKMFSIRNKCYYILLEEQLGNPDNVSTVAADCGFCPFCRKERIFPSISKSGTAKVIFDVFIPPAQNGLVKQQPTLTLKAIVNIIRDYPNARFLITKSKAKEKIAPDTIKKMLFLLLAADILTLQYDVEEKKAVFCLARTSPGSSIFAINENEFWNNIELK